jgi:hypothetical protein
LKLTQNPTPILYEVLHEIQPSDAKPHEICGIFALLGGSLEAIRPACRGGFRTPNGENNIGVRVSDTEIVQLPITPTSQTIETDLLWAEPTVDFSPLMFPSVDFIASFFQVATNRLTSPQALLYLRSLASYLAEAELIDCITIDFARQALRLLAPIMNPPNRIRVDVLTLLKNLEKPEEKCGDLNILHNEDHPGITFVSEVFCGRQTVRLDILNPLNASIGFFGETGEEQLPYHLIHISKPGTVNLDCHTKKMTCSFQSQKVFALRSCDLFRLFIHVEQGTPSVKLTVSRRKSARPIIPTIGFDESPNTVTPLFTPSRWAFPDSREADQLWRKLQDLPQVSIRNLSSENAPPQSRILLDFRQSSVLSPSLKQWSFHYYVGSISRQLATIIAMRFVILGFAHEIEPHFLSRLFSLLAIIIERPRLELFQANEFPFNGSPSLQFEFEDEARTVIEIIARDNEFPKHFSDV